MIDDDACAGREQRRQHLRPAAALCLHFDLPAAPHDLDIWLMVGSGAIGYLLGKFDFDMAPLLLRSCSASASR
jgi:hypothetical protein